jgi:hypothetical protein
MEGKAAQDKALLNGNQQLFEKVKNDIKSFINLMHDALVWFY